MKNRQEIEDAVEGLNKTIANTELRKDQYASRGDSFMVSLEINRLSQYQGKVSALEWVLSNENKD